MDSVNQSVGNNTNITQDLKDYEDKLREIKELIIKDLVKREIAMLDIAEFVTTNKEGFFDYQDSLNLQSRRTNI